MSGPRYGVLKLKDRDELMEFLGEGFHTAFRKAVVDSYRATAVHDHIRNMRSEEWGAVLEFVVGGMELSGVLVWKEDP